MPDGAPLLLHAMPDPAHDDEARPLPTHAHQMRNTLAIICALMEMELQHAPPTARDGLQRSLVRLRVLDTLAVVCTRACHQALTLVELLDTVLTAALRTLGSSATLRCDGHADVRVGLRAGSYVSLACAELACLALADGLPCVAPALHLADDGAEVHLTLTWPAGAGMSPAPLSREILHGFVERSLGGRIDYGVPAPNAVALHLPRASLTSHCE